MTQQFSRKPTKNHDEPGSGVAYLEAMSLLDTDDPFSALDIPDNKFNRFDLNLSFLSDPDGERFDTDVNFEGKATLFGTVRRKLVAEERAVHVGLAPGQVRRGLRGSREMLHQLETFLIALGQRSMSLEPLTYALAWLLECRGSAFIKGHQLMDQIRQEIQPGGRLHSAFGECIPFRKADQWQSVRDRARAIHDGILETINGN